ncbi:MAG: HD domain-containing protein [Nitrospirae bacterium]|nr:HD domain-containing protein [Nitrospirota bacterium]
MLRVAGFLHDIGHGPFGHFFDDNVLDEYKETPETIGQLFSKIYSDRKSDSGLLDLSC